MGKEQFERQKVKQLQSRVMDIKDMEEVQGSRKISCIKHDREVAEEEDRVNNFLFGGDSEG